MRTAPAKAKPAAALETLAINGGEKTIKHWQARSQPKVGVEEFLALADVWGYSRAARDQIRKIVEKEADNPSPQLTRYYNPRPSQVAKLEEYARKLFGVNYALAVNSGTSALNAAYVGAGIGPGDEVIVPAYTFFATAAAVVTAKAIPVIAEVDESLTIDPNDVERKITPRTKAIVPVHMVGNCADMDPIMKIARKHKLLVIEDNAQSCGGTYKGQLLGTIGNMGCFSLSSYKITGAGEAGLVLTNDEWLYIRATSQHDTAACWRPDRYAEERRPGELFCGQNYRLSEMEGATNLLQLKKTRGQAKRYNTNTRRIVAKLGKFRDTKLRRSNDPLGDVGYTIVLFARDSAAAGQLADALRAEGLSAGARGTKTARDWHIYKYWEHILEQKTATDEGCPFTCPYYEGPLPEYSEDMCPTSLDLLDRAVYVYVDQWWTADDCRQVASAINKVCGAYG
ncbi:MAG: aminotransferase class V-fold PLP-dependent enzyme [Armatimonadota bacterium]|jgi:8-amino-3,8-dideoxy-alpha-D-manno-octulosonate transaminase